MVQHADNAMINRGVDFETGRVVYIHFRTYIFVNFINQSILTPTPTMDENEG